MREQGNWVRGTCFFNRVRDFQGLKVPTQMKVRVNGLNGPFLHQMEVKDISWETAKQRGAS